MSTIFFCGIDFYMLIFVCDMYKLMNRERGVVSTTPFFME
jgi:hypothetical protein